MGVKAKFTAAWMGGTSSPPGRGAGVGRQSGAAAAQPSERREMSCSL
ncbi:MULTISPECIES: hypothetical protein [Streptomyces violaceusniger group]|nr:MULTISPECIES: hypothetical protein [Streptomyces violaceusniger group]